MKLPELTDKEYETIQGMLASEQDASLAAQDIRRVQEINEIIQKFHDSRRQILRKTVLRD